MNEDWNAYSKMVLHELERLNLGLEKLEEGQKQIEKDIIRLQTKATIWGSMGGLVATLLSSLVIHFMTSK
tara:strand:+ start:749 stop:958 length:210 start_codon:yes stop_codon:yes gene_type:complete